MTDKLIQALDKVTEKIKKLKKEEAELKEQLLEKLDVNIQLELIKKDEPYGVVHIEGLEIIVPKKVMWDQDKLATLYQNILISNEDPKDYIDLTYKVAESKYKAWPESVRCNFTGARSVEPGSPTVKIEKE